jgi:hypothetical protein
MRGWRRSGERAGDGDARDGFIDILFDQAWDNATGSTLEFMC